MLLNVSSVKGATKTKQKECCGTDCKPAAHAENKSDFTTVQQERVPGEKRGKADVHGWELPA